MGWGRTLLLGDIGNRLDIGDVERNVTELKRQLTDAYRSDMSQDEKIEKLIEENAQLKLFLASLIRLLTAKGTISQEELQTMVASLDAEDGRSDGHYEGEIA